MASHFEQTRKSLESLLQSADKGKALFEDLRKFSFETTFGVDELASASSQLINAGVATKDLRAQLKMLGDVAQGDKGKFAELTSVFAKVQLMGKAGAQTISQFNIRGVPLNKTLKEMGVIGTASAKQVTEALQKLTAEGGQFHDAMNNIIDTIEGKRGFIDDTIKEIKVNLGEVTGLTQAYKASLDAMYEVYDKINNKLMEWNKNPVMQAIIRGTIVGGITAIGLAITTAVIPALIKTIAQLQIIATLKAMINPTGLLVGLGISAVVGLGMAVKTIADNEKAVNDELIEQIKLRQTLGEIPLTATTDEKSDYLKIMEEQLKQYQQLQQTSAQKYTSGVFEGYFDTLAQYERLIKKAEEKLAGFESRGIKKGSIVTQMNANGKIERVDTRTQEQKELEKTEQDLQRLKKTYDDLKKSYDTNLYYKSLQKNIEGLSKEIELQKELEATTKKLNDYSPWAKQEQGIKELQTQLEEINKMYEQVGVKSKNLDKQTGEYKYEYDLIINFDPSYKQQLQEVKEEIEKELSDAEIKLKLSKMKDWQKDLQNALGLDDKTASDLIGKAGDKWIEKALELRDARKKVQEDTYKKIGINQSNKDSKSSIANEVKEVLAIIEPLMKEGKFGAVGKNGELDNTFVKLNSELDSLKDKFIKAGGTLEEWDIIVGNSAQNVKNNLGSYAGNTMLNGLKSHSGDVSSAMEGFQSGGIWGAVIGVIINAFYNVASSVEGFEEVMNPVTTAMQELKPFIQWLVGKLASYTKHLEAIFTVIGDLFEVLEPLINDILDSLIEPINATLSVLGYLLKLITPLIKAVADVLHTIWSNTLGKLVGGLKGLNDSFAETRKVVDDTKKAEEERLKALTNAYSNMLSTLRDVQEEYEKRRKQINSQTYAESVTGVHDMILTPQGKFSTDPDDYIIATKNPSALNGGGSPNVIINNYSNSNVETRTDDNGNLIIQISQKVAYDYANGNNGWDSAVMARQARVAGRNLAM